MRPGRTIGVLIAMTASAGAHLALLNAFIEQRSPVLIKGGSIQVEIGAASASSPASAAGSQAGPPEAAIDENTKNTEPVEPQPEPKPHPKSITERDAETTANEKPVTPFAPLDDPYKSAHGETSEAEGAPEREKTVAPLKMAPPAAEQSENGAKTEEQRFKAADGGEPSAASAGDGSGEASDAQPANKAGNAESENYAGAVMAHLSRVRRPRASVPGAALVAFTIAPSGELESISIARSSGSAQFDRDALKMVERAAPFPKPPSGVNREFVVEIEGS